MKKNTSGDCCPTAGNISGIYRIESVVSVDDRGQMVLPKEVRERMNIKSGDKVAVVIMEREGAPCCATLIKADDFSTVLQDMLGPAGNTRPGA